MEIVHDFMVKILIFKLNIVQNYKCQIIFKILNDIKDLYSEIGLGWAAIQYSCKILGLTGWVGLGIRSLVVKIDAIN